MNSLPAKTIVRSLLAMIYNDSNRSVHERPPRTVTKKAPSRLGDIRLVIVSAFGSGARTKLEKTIFVLKTGDDSGTERR